MAERKLLVIGLDAVEAPLLRELIDAGRLPQLAALEDLGVASPVETSCMSLLPGAIWQDILTGINAGHHGDYYPSRIHTGESSIREIDPRAHSDQYFFTHAAKAGLRVISIDQPLVPAFTPATDLTLIAEWHVHDAIWERGTHPKGLLAELEERFGERPYDRCDTNHGTTPESLQEFGEMLCRELSIKIDMAEYVMASRPWDLFTIGISQGHCAGHQLWQHHDAARTAAEGHLPSSDQLTEVYEAIDGAIGRLVHAAGDDTDVVVFTSHGMNAYIGGPQLLPPLLEAWGYGNPRPQLSLVRRVIPMGLVERVFRRAPWFFNLVTSRGTLNPRLAPSTTAIAVPNNRVGAIRLNLSGREPAGSVTDADRAITELEARLREVRHCPSGEPIVDRTVRPADVYGSDHHPDLPDLLVVFRRDLGEITEVDCPVAGHFDVPIRKSYYPRFGDHTDESHIWAVHPNVSGLRALKSEDIAPTLLAMLDVPIPSEIDGQVAATFHHSANP